MIGSLSPTEKIPGVFETQELSLLMVLFYISALRRTGSLYLRLMQYGVSVALVTRERAQLSFGVGISKLVQSKRIAWEV